MRAGGGRWRLPIRSDCWGRKVRYCLKASTRQAEARICLLHHLPPLSLLLLHPHSSSPNHVFSISIFLLYIPIIRVLLLPVVPRDYQVLPLICVSLDFSFPSSSHVSALTTTHFNLVLPSFSPSPRIRLLFVVPNLKPDRRIHRQTLRSLVQTLFFTSHHQQERKR